MADAIPEVDGPQLLPALSKYILAEAKPTLPYIPSTHHQSRKAVNDFLYFFPWNDKSLLSIMEQEFNSETESDYTSYWRDWVSAKQVSFSI